MLSGLGIIRLDLSKDDDAISSIVTLLKEVCSFTDEDDKKLKKTKLKEATKLARILLDKTADCSICSIEVSLPLPPILSTSGLLASTFLDSGASQVVIPLDKSLSGVSAARLPKERVVGSLTREGLEKGWEDIEGLREKVAGVCIECGDCNEEEASAAARSLSATFSSLPPTFTLVVVCPSSSAPPPTLLSWRSGHALRVRACLTDATAAALGGGFCDACKTDRSDGLYTTVVCSRSGVALGLVYSSRESVVAALEAGKGVYYSRSRGGLWRKGDTSGHYQTLHRIDTDCDGDALRFTVTQHGSRPAFCHLNTLTCWGEPVGTQHLEEVLRDRLVNAPEGSYTKRLFDDETLLRNKLVEEAQELSEATSPRHVAEELADVLYFALVRAVKAGVGMDDAVK
eukprot:CAMPEP_0197553374 /NCGR_PEP_ID=MMETSP1320-20131121/8757_1 /TAXON_ID=91990 /ORGANISM="Bolidomonas sp., Strain RCC2347" /LENGTH=399 /DNA_ID=CAMNT_0043114119 /DNA_START=32 /DNA_END=1228 /DNA_ORIENTATION=-